MSDGESGNDGLVAHAKDKGTGCHWRAAGHIYSYRRFKALAATAAVAIGVASAIAGSALLSSAGGDWAVAAGAIGLLGAVLAAAERGFDLTERIDDNRDAARRFGAMRNGFWGFADNPPGDSAKAHERFAELVREHEKLEKEAIPLEGWAERKSTAGWEAAIGKARG